MARVLTENHVPLIKEFTSEGKYPKAIVAYPKEAVSCPIYSFCGYYDLFEIDVPEPGVYMMRIKIGAVYITATSSDTFGDLSMSYLVYDTNGSMVVSSEIWNRADASVTDSKYSAYDTGLYADTCVIICKFSGKGKAKVKMTWHGKTCDNISENSPKPARVSGAYAIMVKIAEVPDGE